MITAKDQFIVEREMIADMNRLLYGSNLDSYEREQVLDRLNEIDQQEYEELKRTLTDRQINSLDRVRNGEYLNQSQINEAVRLAVKNE